MRTRLSFFVVHVIVLVIGMSYTSCFSSLLFLLLFYVECVFFLVLAFHVKFQTSDFLLYVQVVVVVVAAAAAVVDDVVVLLFHIECVFCPVVIFHVTFEISYECVLCSSLRKRSREICLNGRNK